MTVNTEYITINYILKTHCILINYSTRIHILTIERKKKKFKACKIEININKNHF